MVCRFRDNLLNVQRERHPGHPLAGLRILDVGCGGGLLAEVRMCARFPPLCLGNDTVSIKAYCVVSVYLHFFFIIVILKHFGPCCKLVCHREPTQMNSEQRLGGGEKKQKNTFWCHPSSILLFSNWWWIGQPVVYSCLSVLLLLRDRQLLFEQRT